MGDDPAFALPAEADGQAQPVDGIAAEFLLGAAAQQRPGEGHVLAGGDVELDELVSLGEGHPRATMLIAQQAHAATLADRARRVDLGRVRQGLALAMAADAAGLDGDVERIRSLGKNTLTLARLLARGQRPYGTSGAPPAAVGRALDSLRDAGYLEHRRRGDWQLIDPLLRRRLIR